MGPLRPGTVLMKYTTEPFNKNTGNTSGLIMEDGQVVAITTGKDGILDAQRLVALLNAAVAPSAANNAAIEESCLYCDNAGTRGSLIYSDELDSWFCPHGCEALYSEYGSPENE